jgi:hypothetical protein
METPTHQNMIGRSITASRPVTKQYSSASFDFITLLLPQGKICTPFKNVITPISPFLKLRRLGLSLFK